MCIYLKKIEGIFYGIEKVLFIIFFSFFVMYAQLSSLFKAFRENETSELEVAISQKGQNGLPFEVFNDLFSLMEHWTEEKILVFKGCFTVKDFFYANSVRSRVILGYGINSKNEETQNITKTKIASIHAKCPERKYVQFNIQLKDEIPFNDPISVSNEYMDVRIQLIWEFDCKNTFRYFFKQVQSGKTVEDACQNQIQYEIEIEINRDSPLFLSSTDEEMASKLIEKTLDLAGRKNVKTGEIEALTMDLFSNKNKHTETKRKYISKKLKIE